MTTNSNQSIAAPETRKEVAEWLGISQSTLRSWDGRFSGLLEAEPGQKGSAVKKRYTENDLIVFLAIKNLRDKNLTFDEIEESLEQEITRTYLPEWGGKEEASAAPASTALVAQNRQLTNRIIDTETKLAASMARAKTIAEERDRLLEQLDKAQDKLLEAEKRALKAEMLLEAKKAQEEEPSRPWWRFWES